MMSEDVKLLEGIMSDMREDIRGIRTDLHTFIGYANKVDAEQGVQIANLQARMINVERSVEEASKDRRQLWERVWQFGITGALIAQIVMGSPWDSVVGK